eukprot:Ihof_evm2s605 gene=Ihof_evmTU2s605
MHTTGQPNVNASLQQPSAALSTPSQKSPHQTPLLQNPPYLLGPGGPTRGFMGANARHTTPLLPQPHLSMRFPRPPMPPPINPSVLNAARPHMGCGPEGLCDGAPHQDGTLAAPLGHATPSDMSMAGTSLPVYDVFMQNYTNAPLPPYQPPLQASPLIHQQQQQQQLLIQQLLLHHQQQLYLQHHQYLQKEQSEQSGLRGRLYNNNSQGMTGEQKGIRKKDRERDRDRERERGKDRVCQQISKESDMPREYGRDRNPTRSYSGSTHQKEYSYEGSGRAGKEKNSYIYGESNRGDPLRRSPHSPDNEDREPTGAGSPTPSHHSQLNISPSRSISLQRRVSSGDYPPTTTGPRVRTASRFSPVVSPHITSHSQHQSSHRSQPLLNQPATNATAQGVPVSRQPSGWSHPPRSQSTSGSLSQNWCPSNPDDPTLPATPGRTSKGPSHYPNQHYGRKDYRDHPIGQGGGCEGESSEGKVTGEDRARMVTEMGLVADKTLLAHLQGWPSDPIEMRLKQAADDLSRIRDSEVRLLAEYRQASHQQLLAKTEVTKTA